MFSKLDLSPDGQAVIAVMFLFLGFSLKGKGHRVHGLEDKDVIIRSNMHHYCGGSGNAFWGRFSGIRLFQPAVLDI